MAELKNATPYRFSTLWFDHDLDGKIKDDPQGMHDIYDQNSGAAPDTVLTNDEHITVSLVDKDGDPMIGDFGKIDILDNKLESSRRRLR